MSDDDEWGNIELSGLSDEELYRKDWVKSAREKEKWKKSPNSENRRKNIRKGVEKRNQDPEYFKKLHKAISSPEHKLKLSQASKKSHAENPNLRYSGVENLLKKKETKEYQENYYAGIDRRNKNKEWQENVSKAAKARAKKLITPYGTFNGVNEVLKHTGKHFHSKMKQMPHLYYYEDEGPGEYTYEKVFNTPYGSFNSKRIVHQKAKEKNDNIALSNVSESQYWKQVIKLMTDDFYEQREIKREWDLEDD